MDFGDYRCSVCGEMLIEQAKQCPNCPTEAEERMLPLINQIADLRSSNANLEESIRTIGEENNELTKENARLREALVEIKEQFSPSFIPMSEYATGYKDALRSIASIAAKALEGK